jgi:Amt family ammonium transporter
MSSSNTTNPLSPPWLDRGDNAWQLTAATLVGLQSIPGLVVLYAGIVKRKWALNSAFMAFYAFAAVLICWVLWAYKASFGEQMLPFVGVPGPVVSMNDELKQTLLPASGLTAAFPLSTMGQSLSNSISLSCYQY